MKLLPKLGPIVILLVVINGNACFAETPKQIMSWLPDPNKCLDLLELEKVEVNPQRQTISGDSRLVEDYRVVASWLEGFFTAWNLKSASGVDVKDATSYQMMTWMFGFSRSTFKKQKPSLTARRSFLRKFSVSDIFRGSALFDQQRFRWVQWVL